MERSTCSIEQAAHVVAELSADRAREQQADLLEQAADLVLQIATDANHAGQCARIGRCLALEHNLPVLIDHAHGGLFLRHIQSHILFHGCSPVGCFAEADAIGPPVRRRAAIRDYATCGIRTPVLG